MLIFFIRLVDGYSQQSFHNNIKKHKHLPQTATAAREKKKTPSTKISKLIIIFDVKQMKWAPSNVLLAHCECKLKFLGFASNDSHNDCQCCPFFNAITKVHHSILRKKINVTQIVTFKWITYQEYFIANGKETTNF